MLTAFRLPTEDVKNGKWSMLGSSFESTTLDLRPLMPYTLGVIRQIMVSGYSQQREQTKRCLSDMISSFEHHNLNGDKLYMMWRTMTFVSGPG